MKRIAIRNIIVSLAVVSLLLAFWSLYHGKESQKKISEFGKYQGYSEVVYDGRQRTSDYLTLSDGTRLAYDLFLPTKDGVPADGPLPSLFKYTPYNRAWTIFDKDGKAVLCDLMPVWYCEPMLRFRGWVMPDGRGQIKDAVSRIPWLRTDAPDLDTFVYLEEVNGNGNSTYITEGALRASHRTLSPAPFDTFGLPWSNHVQSELQPIPAVNLLS